MKERKPEDIFALIDIRRYRSISDDALRHVLSREIYEHFIVRGARYEVNISDSTRNQVENAVTNLQQPLLHHRSSSLPPAAAVLFSSSSSASGMRHAFLLAVA